MEKVDKKDKQYQILVVDDEESVRILLELYLTNKGYTVKSVMNAEKAIIEIEKRAFQVVLLDIRMPGMDGIDLSIRIKQEYPSTQVIIMTGYASIGTAAKAIRIGAFDYLLKPFADVSLVGVAVEKAIEKQQKEADYQKVVEDLREREQHYRFLIENVADVIWTMDINLRNTYISPAIESLRGYSVEEAMAQDIGDMLSPSSLEVAMKVLEEELALELMEQKDTARFKMLELELTCKDGSTVWTEVKMTFMRDEEGQTIGILGVTRDISDRKQ